MRTDRPNPIDRRLSAGSLIVPVALLAVGIFALFRWETGGPAFWTASVVFVAGSLAFYCLRHRHRSIYNRAVEREAEHGPGPVDRDR